MDEKKVQKPAKPATSPQSQFDELRGVTRQTRKAGRRHPEPLEEQEASDESLPF